MRGIVLALALVACVKREDTVPCDHVNDRASWAQTNLSAAGYDSAMKAQGKRCLP